MTSTAERIVKDALSLSPHARAFVAERLLESLDSIPGQELSAAWRNEIQRRTREIDEGTVELLDSSEVFAKAHSALP